MDRIITIQINFRGNTMDYAIGTNDTLNKETNNSFNFFEHQFSFIYPEYLKTYSDIMSNIKEKGQMYEFNAFDMIEKLVQVILRICAMDGTYENNEATPIVRLAKKLQFKVYNSEALPNNALGNLIIIADHEESTPYNEQYLYNKLIIALHPSVPLEKRRFIIAHELGHYFLDYLGSTYEKADIPSGKVRYAAPYKPDIGLYPIPSETRADRFAASMLMPKQLFRQEYYKLIEEKYDLQFALNYLSTYFNVSKTAVTRRIDEVIT